MKVCPEFEAIRTNLPGPKKMKWAPRFHTCERSATTSIYNSPFYCCEPMTKFVQQTTGNIISPLFNSHQLKEKPVNLIDDFVIVTTIELAFNDQKFWNLPENPRREPRVPVCTFDGQDIKPLDKFRRRVNNARSQVSIAWTNYEGMQTCAKHGWEPYTGPKDILHAQAAVQSACDNYNALICRFLLAAVEYRAKTPYRFLNARPVAWQFRVVDRDTNNSLRLNTFPHFLEPDRLIRRVDETGKIVPVINPPPPNRAEVVGIAIRPENHLFFAAQQLWAHACDLFTDSDTESEYESDDETMEF